MTKDLRTADFDYLLDEVLFELHQRDIIDPDEADPVLNQVIVDVSRKEKLSPSPDDSKALAALVYEQLTGWRP